MNILFKALFNKQSNLAYNDTEQKLIIYQSELDYLSKCILEYPHVETGGNLFGLWTPFGIPIIHYVVGPGPNAIHETTHFKQDFNFLDKNADLLVGEHALHHIGTWHSHHSLNLSKPSDGDTESTLSGMKECNLTSFILLIGNYRNGKSTVNAFRYFNNGSRVKLKWVILNGISPVRLIYDKMHTDWIYTPAGTASMLPLETCSLIEGRRTVIPKPQFDSQYWLEQTENKKEFVKIINFLKTQYEHVSIYQLNESAIEVRVESKDDIFKFIFDSTFPKKSPQLLAPKNKQLKYKSKPEWDIANKSISDAFIHFFKTIQL